MGNIIITPKEAFEVSELQTGSIEWWGYPMMRISNVYIHIGNMDMGIDQDRFGYGHGIQNLWKNEDTDTERKQKKYTYIFILWT